MRCDEHSLSEKLFAAGGGTMKHVIFVSDTHIGDGSSKDDFNQDDVIENLVADWSTLENPELVIVGDGFELLESDTVRSLGVTGFWETVDLIDRTLIDRIVQVHPKVFRSLSNFPGRIWYVVGNHDYYLWKNKNLQDALKEYLPNLEIVPYYLDSQAGILAVHGNQFDSINKFKEIDGELVPPLGDFIARYMMVNFDESLRSYVPEEVLKDYDNVRPVLDVFDWLEKISQLYQTGVDLIKIWVDNFLEMMKHEEAKNWMKKNYPALSKLSVLFLNRTGGIRLGELIVRTVMKMRNMRKTDYLKKAATKIFESPSWMKKHMDGYLDKQKRYDFEEITLNGIVMGHNHRPSFDVLKIKGELKFYLNCGSWKPVVERRGHNMFQRFFEIFYAITKIESDGEIEIITGSINKLRKSHII